MLHAAAATTRRKFAGPLFISAIVALLFYRLIFLSFPPFHALTLTLKLSAPKDVIQAAYKSTLADEYNLSDLKTQYLTESTGPQSITFALPASEIGFIRIDPASSPAELNIYAICLARSDKPAIRRCWNAEEISRDFISRQHITVFELRNDSVFLKNIGSDPYFETRPELENYLKSFARASVVPHWMLLMIITILSFIISVRVLASPPADSVRSPARCALSGILSIAVFAAVFLFMTGTIRESTPPFAGPDEYMHLAKLISYELDRPCGTEPIALGMSLTSVPLGKFGSGPLADGFPAANSDEFVERANNTCRYSNAYLLLPHFLNRLSGNRFDSASVIRYIENTRRAVSISAAFCLFLPLFIIIFGRPLWSGMIDSPQSLRYAAILGSLYMIFLPQTLWIGAVAGQDYLLISAGMLMAVSVFFRVPILSDILIPLSIYASASKIIYCVPFLFLALLHYAALVPRFAGLPQRLSLKSACYFFALVIFSPLAILPAIKYLGRSYCADNFCFGLQRSGLLDSWGRFSEELKTMRVKFHVLSLPSSFHEESAFGNFGWLDAPMQTQFAHLYSVPVMWLLLLSTVLMSAIVFTALLRPRRFEFRRLTESLALAAIVLLYWLICFICVYAIFWAMVEWCGPSAGFGCAYQRRYELPFYPLIIISLFYAGFVVLSAAMRNNDARGAVRNILYLLLLCVQCIVIWRSWHAQIEVLRERYEIPIESNFG